MFKFQAVMLIVVLAGSTVLAAPPVRKFDDPGAPPFKVLNTGENPPLDADGNFVIGPEYVPAPERKKVEGVPEGKVEQFVNRNGYEASGIEPLAGAVDEAHRSVFDQECEVADSPECSMWRDHNVYNEMGIPALTYGPPGRAGTGAYALARTDLLNAARVYALTALALCA